MPFRQLKSFLKILIGVQYDRMKESNFLIPFVGCALLRLFKILAGRVHIEFKATPHNCVCVLRRIFSANSAV